MILKNILNILESNFNINKTKTPIFFTDSPQEYISTFEINISKAIEEIFEKINLSILAGEYFVNEDVKIHLENIYTKIDDINNNIKNIIPTNIKNIEPNIEHIFYNKFLLIIKAALNEYEGLSHYVNRNIEYGDDVLTGPYFKKNDTKIIDNENIHVLFLILRFNINLCQIDFRINTSYEVVNHLLWIKTTLENEIEIENPYKNIIYDKCLFLLKKILYRYNEKGKEYLYSIEFQDTTINPEDIKILYYTEFENKCIDHYNKKITLRKEKKEQIKKILTKYSKSENLTLGEYHYLVKHFKDEKKSYNEVNKLYDKFDKFYEETIARKELKKYDQYAYNICYNYLFNNRISSFLTKKDIDFHTIEKEIEKIDEIQNKTEIHNYFPYKKICNYLNNVINILIDNFDITNYEIINKYLILFEKCQSSLEKKIVICNRINFLAYQLPFNECILKKKINGKEYTIFLYSSFVLPIEYNEEEIISNKHLNDLNKYRLLLDMKKNIFKENENILQLKNEIKKYDKRSIEILAIFSAIIAFVFGSIQIFGNQDITVKGSIIFMFTFGYNLVLFIYLIWIITREDISKIKIYHWSILLIFIIFSGFLILSLTGIIDSEMINGILKSYLYNKYYMKI